MKPFVKYLYFVGALTLFAGIGFVLPDFLDNPVTGTGCRVDIRQNGVDFKRHEGGNSRICDTNPFRAATAF